MVAALPRSAILGAGSSGITAVKALADRGLPFDCFEKGDRVGGNWVLGNSNGMSSAYRGLYINTSRDRLQYADFPMPREYPDFPHHTQMAAYFDAYVRSFGLVDRICFETEVQHVRRRDDGIWELVLRSGDRTFVREYDALIVANGHHWDPRWPEPAFEGTFAGEVLHAHHYVDALKWSGRRVVVVGMGNSAMDIAVEASYVAERTFLAMRRGAWVLPKYMFGKPVDQLATYRHLPLRARQRIFEIAYKLAVGDLATYGLPKPDHRMGEAHPTISGRILDRLSHGAITPKPNIAKLVGDGVQFTDGSVEKADVIVYCTGYKVTFPFFEPGLVEAKDNDLPLYRRVFEPRIPNLFFLGLLQPLGAIMPLAEAQSKWIAAHLAGEYALPDRDAMLADMAKERAAMFARYVASKRHTMQVDYDEYLEGVGEERERGRTRAAALRKRASANAEPWLPIPARAKSGNREGPLAAPHREP